MTIASLVQGPALAGATGSATSGSAAAIALYKAAARATNDLPAYVIDQRGYVRIHTSIGKHRAMEWAWGQDQFQKGEVATTERLVLVQNHGVVAWIEDTLTPDVKCDSETSCASKLPLQFVITKTRAFVGIISSKSSATASCFTREPLDDVPYAAGTSWWWADGAYQPIAHDGHLSVVTSSYPNAGQVETEKDWIADPTMLFVHSLFVVAASRGHRAFNFSASYTKLSGRPAAPHLSLCS